MKLLVISSSHRTPSQSLKVGQYMTEQATMFKQINHLQLNQYDLPWWDGDSEASKGKHWPYISSLLQQADAYVLITPEWSGMATPLLKNLLMMCESELTGHKPVLLVSVVSGISGAYPISELLMSAFKNNKMVAIPDYLIIRHVETRLNHKINQANHHDQSIRQRIHYSLNMLSHYSQTLIQLRQNIPTATQYRYGM